MGWATAADNVTAVGAGTGSVWMLGYPVTDPETPWLTVHHGAFYLQNRPNCAEVKKETLVAGVVDDAPDRPGEP